MDSGPPKRPVAFRGASATLPRAFRADPLSETVAGHVGHPLYLSFKHAALPRAFRGHHAFRGPFRDLPRNLVHLFTPSADNNNVRCKVPMLERLKKTQLKWIKSTGSSRILEGSRLCDPGGKRSGVGMYPLILTILHRDYSTPY